MTTKKTLYADTVLRKDGGKLYLMNRQEGGFRSWAQPIDDEQWLLDRYHVRLGSWDRDEHGEYCPVTRVPREELPTLHDGEEVLKPHDFGVRGSMEHSVLASLPSVTEADAMRAFMGGHVRHHVFATDGYKEDHTKPFPVDQLGRNGSMVFGVGGSLIQGSRDPEAFAMKVRMDSGPHGDSLIPYVVNGEVVRSDSIEEIRARALAGMPVPQDDGEDSKRAYRAFVDDTDWDAIGDALGDED